MLKGRLGLETARLPHADLYGTIVGGSRRWWSGMPGGSIVLTWRDNAASGRLGILTLGLPKRTLGELDGALLVRRD